MYGQRQLDGQVEEAGELALAGDDGAAGGPSPWRDYRLVSVPARCGLPEAAASTANRQPPPVDGSA